ncbi:MAG: hypothetical protein NZ921_00720 [Candidatus Caldarchaeum sp.]|nr:hypothetical protein [Candidatus Caldarchaeum sp.]MCS7133311.1 hypothetical protein [Candidatus Caldarchaeum sp.]MCX8201880.1 hypothetical protein [Candidatus Caldarchaeum sp.]MDW8435691.1 hypothetical protein [Candidatus Caldarchaeum sp.]
MKRKKPVEKIDDKMLRKAVATAKNQPRLAFYSPLAAAVLNYKKNTVPRYSMSDELAKIVEAALRQKYPALTQRVKRLMKSGNKEAKGAETKRPVQEYPEQEGGS